MTETRMVYRTELTEGPEYRRPISYGTQSDTDLTPEQFATARIDITRAQRPWERGGFQVTAWREPIDTEPYRLRDCPIPPGATTVIAAPLDPEPRGTWEASSGSGASPRG